MILPAQPGTADMHSYFLKDILIYIFFFAWEGFVCKTGSYYVVETGL